MKESRGTNQYSCRRTAKSVTKKIMFTDENKKILWRKLSMSKKDRIYAQSSKKAHEVVPRIEQGHYPVFIFL